MHLRLSPAPQVVMATNASRRLRLFATHQATRLRAMARLACGGLGAILVFGGALPPASAGTLMLPDPSAEIAAQLPVTEAENLAESTVPSPFAGLNLNAFLGAERYYNAGFTGTNTVLANIEAGVVWDGHQDFSGAGHVNYIPPQGDALSLVDNTDLHATAVSHLMAGRGGAAYPNDPFRWGIAHGAEFWSGGIATGWAVGPTYSQSFITNLATLALTYEMAITDLDGSGTRADVINSSWGLSGIPQAGGGFTLDSVMADSQVYNSRVTMVFAAGNDGPAQNSLGSPASAYNTIAVGSLANNGNAYDVLATSSSRSPSDFFFATSSTTAVTIPNVRAAIDLVAPGELLLAAAYVGLGGGNQTGANLFGSPPSSGDYVVASGTSFAAPLVAGGAALLVDAGKSVYAADGDAIDPLVVKAVLMNSADKLPGWTNALTPTADAGGVFSPGTVLRTTQSLDWGLGAGRMNLDAAFDQYITTTNGGMAGTANVSGTSTGIPDVISSVAPVGWDFGLVQAINGTPSSNLYFISEMLMGDSLFSATLTWFAERLFDHDATDDSFTAEEVRFADLNLRVFEYDNPTDQNILGIVAESVSIYNLTEHLWFQLPRDGYYGFSVDFADNLWNFGSDEIFVAYGVAWSGILVPEPGRVVLLCAGIGLLLARRRRGRPHASH